MLNNIQIIQKKGEKEKTKMKNRTEMENKIIDLNLIKSVIIYNVSGLNLTIRR